MRMRSKAYLAKLKKAVKAYADNSPRYTEIMDKLVIELSDAQWNRFDRDFGPACAFFKSIEFSESAWNEFLRSLTDEE